MPGLIEALSAYERAMVEYAFRAVRASLKEMERFHSTRRVVTKTIFRVVDLLPRLQATFHGNP